MTLEEILALEEEGPCPGCPVCAPRLPRRRTAASRGAEHETEGARAMELETCTAGGPGAGVGRFFPFFAGAMGRE